MSSEYHVADRIEVAQTLPAEAFTDAAYLQRELRTLFSKTWLCLPQRQAAELRDDGRELSDAVSARGARFPFSLLDRPFFLQRGWKDRKLRLFPNVCTHAWYPLVLGPGRSSSLTCAQHGRQFDCAGKFLSQPGFKNCPDFPRQADHLSQMPVEAWGPLLFASLGKPAGSFSSFFGEFAKTTRKLPMADLQRRPQAGEIRELDGNWKQHAWNYMDKFHITFIHRSPGGLADAIDLNSYRTELHPYSSLQWVYAKNPASGFNPDWLPKRFSDPQDPSKRVLALWWFVFPNLALNFYPWGLSVNVYMPVPGKPERTLFYWYLYSWDDAKFARREELWLSDQVDREDIDAMAQARRGARSGFAPRGRFSPSEERGPHWFHQLAYKFAFESNFGV